MCLGSRWLVLFSLVSVLVSTAAHAGTISITFVLTSGSGGWTSMQSGGQAITLGSGSAVVEIPGSGPLSPTGSMATLQSLFATGLGPFANAHSLQLFGIPATVIGSSPTGFTASAGGGTALGSVGGPSGVLPLSVFAGLLFDVSSVATNGSAIFRLLGGGFSGATTAQVTQAFVGTEVSRTFVPEPSTGILFAGGVILAVLSARRLSVKRRR